MLINKYLYLGSMSRRRRKSKSEADYTSVFVYVSGNGELKHELFPEGYVNGVFEWEKNLDFFVTLDSWDDDYDDLDY